MQAETIPIAVFTAAEFELESAVVLLGVLPVVLFVILLSSHCTLKGPVAPLENA